MENKTILVVEDNELNMKLVRSLLSLGKYAVLEAVNAENGIQLARVKVPDLILMDIQLPDMDGLSATKLLKKDPATAGIPVVALTSYAMQGDEQKALDSGCSGYMTKPIDTKNFLDSIGAYLGPSQKAETEFIQVSGHRSRILIVDDEPLNIKLLEAKLSSENYQILRAYSGEEALEIVAQEIPDLILLDIMMPGLDGYEVTQTLKSDPRTKNIPIIMVTALNGSEDKARGMQVGADEFLNKPVNTAELQARVRSLLRLKEYQEQLASRSQSESFLLAPRSEDKLVATEGNLPTILLVEDNEKEICLFKSYLRDQPYRLILARDGKEAIEIVQKEKVDVMLLDLLLPNVDGFEVCKRLKKNELTRNIQIVIITCLSDLKSKIRGIELGTDDYLIKPVHKEELKARIKALIKKKTYLDRLSSKFETALHAAITDKMTGLYNHAYLRHFLDLEIMRSQRQNQTLALFMIDIDNFKQYNDTHGHPAGDELLKKMAQLLKGCIRDVDLAARYGGEEFAVILPYAHRKCALKVAQRIQSQIAAHVFSDRSASVAHKVTISIGVALYPINAVSAAELIQTADDELYRAKRQGKNQVCISEKTSCLAAS